MGWIKRMLDRLVFTAAAIVGLQLPGFVQAYLQRLGGHLDEATLGLVKWQVLAEQYYGGELSELIAGYQASLDPAIRDSGNLIFATSQRAESLQRAMDSLSNQPLWEQLWRLPLNLDLAIAQATWQNYVWTIPLERPALLLGGAFALLACGLLSGLAHLISNLFSKKTAVSVPAYR